MLVPVATEHTVAAPEALRSSRESPDKSVTDPRTPGHRVISVLRRCRGWAGRPAHRHDQAAASQVPDFVQMSEYRHIMCLRYRTVGSVASASRRMAR
jgi:hypothetical protein